MPSFVYYAVGPAFSPMKAVQRLLSEPRPIRAAVWAVGFVGALYTLTSMILALVGAVPLAPVLIGIRPENYYVWQMIYVIPCIVLAWALASALILLPGKKEKGRPDIERTMSLAGVALASSLFIAWIPMALRTLFQAAGMGQAEFVELLSQPGAWQVLYVSLFVLAGMAAAVLLTLASGQGCLPKAGRGKTAAVGIIAAAAVAGTYSLFIR
jgi:hypothetical protein